MRIKELFQDDDAVSPVIGVILMVAITVILAAVIASFVLGLGDTADEVQPTTSFSFDYDDTDETIDVTLADGDSITAENLWIRGELNATEDTVNENWDEIDDLELEIGGESDNVDVEGTGGFEIGVDDEVSAGQGIQFEIAEDPSEDDQTFDTYDFDVVWDTGDDSSTLDSDSGPEA